MHETKQIEIHVGQELCLQGLLPSSKFSFAQDCPLRSVTERNDAPLNLELPRYFEEWLVPFPNTVGTFEFELAADSPASLVLRRGPESENNLPDTLTDRKSTYFSGKHKNIH